MMDYNKTMDILNYFYDDCVRFWKNDGMNDTEAHKMALHDVDNIKYDPYSPSGNELHTMAQHDFVEHKLNGYAVDL